MLPRDRPGNVPFCLSHKGDGVESLHAMPIMLECLLRHTKLERLEAGPAEGQGEAGPTELHADAAYELDGEQSWLPFAAEKISPDTRMDDTECAVEEGKPPAKEEETDPRREDMDELLGGAIERVVPSVPASNDTGVGRCKTMNNELPDPAAPTNAQPTRAASKKTRAQRHDT